MTHRSCDRLWEIDSYREGRLAAKAAKSFDRHLRTCADCRTQMGRDEELRRLARELPVRAPSDLTLRRLRARVLRDAAIGVPDRGYLGRRSGVVFAFVALGLAASLLVVSRSTPRAAVAAKGRATESPPATSAPVGPGAEAFAGSVVAFFGARWSQTREASVERIALEDGAIRVHVRRQLSGERFLVILPDGEIEVRGTTFDVSVEQGATKHVYVAEGTVDLRIRDRATTRLSAEEAYDAPIPPPLTRSVSPGPARPSREAPPPRAATARADHAGAYATAIELLRQGHSDQSAAAFHAFVLAEPGAPEVEDATFLEAVALARAGRADAAALAAEHYLASFPDSFRRKEASILVARAASQRGDCDKARAMLASWTGDSPEMRSAVRPCEGSSH